MCGNDQSKNYFYLYLENIVVGVMMTAMMGMATLSVLTSILVLYLYHHTAVRRAPRWLRRLAFQGLARLLCMHAAVPVDDDLASIAKVEVCFEQVFGIYES